MERPPVCREPKETLELLLAWCEVPFLCAVGLKLIGKVLVPGAAVAQLTLSDWPARLFLSVSLGQILKNLGLYQVIELEFLHPDVHLRQLVRLDLVDGQFLGLTFLLGEHLPQSLLLDGQRWAPCLGWAATVQVDVPHQRLHDRPDSLSVLRLLPFERLLPLEVFLLLLEAEHLLQLVPGGDLWALFDHQLVWLGELLGILRVDPRA